jgi:hypothetical protein
MGLRPDDLYLYADLTQQCWTVTHWSWALGLGVRLHIPAFTFFPLLYCIVFDKNKQLSMIMKLNRLILNLFATPRCSCVNAQIPMIVLYVFGIPIVAFIVLRNNRNELHNIDTRRKYSFLYAVRVPDLYSFKVVYAYLVYTSGNRGISL